MSKLAAGTLFVVMVIAVTLLGCDEGPTLPQTTPGGGWILETQIRENGILIGSEPFVTVHGSFNRDLPGAGGDPANFTTTTNELGLAALVNKRAPATWTLTWFGSTAMDPCIGVTATHDIPLGALVSFICILTSFGASGSVSPSPFSFSPNPLDTTNPPGICDRHRARIQRTIRDALSPVL